VLRVNADTDHRYRQGGNNACQDELKETIIDHQERIGDDIAADNNE
jgi:hypothetical protein